MTQVVTRTLNAQQASALRRYILFSSYAAAAENFQADVLHKTLDRDEDVPAIRAAKEPLARLEAAVDQIGWDVAVPEFTEFTADPDELKKWAVGAFDSARERLGQGSRDDTRGDLVADDHRWADEAECLLPLIDSLPGAEQVAA